MRYTFTYNLIIQLYSIMSLYLPGTTLAWWHNWREIWKHAASKFCSLNKGIVTLILLPHFPVDLRKVTHLRKACNTPASLEVWNCHGDNKSNSKTHYRLPIYPLNCTIYSISSTGREASILVHCDWYMSGSSGCGVPQKNHLYKEGCF